MSEKPVDDITLCVLCGFRFPSDCQCDPVKVRNALNAPTETERPCPTCGTDIHEALRRVAWRSVDPLDFLKLASKRERLDRARDHLLVLLAEAVAADFQFGSPDVYDGLVDQAAKLSARRKELDEGVDSDVTADDGA